MKKELNYENIYQFLKKQVGMTESVLNSKKRKRQNIDANDQVQDQNYLQDFLLKISKEMKQKYNSLSRL